MIIPRDNSVDKTWFQIKFLFGVLKKIVLGAHFFVVATSLGKFEIVEKGS